MTEIKKHIRRDKVYSRRREEPSHAKQCRRTEGNKCRRIATIVEVPQQRLKLIADSRKASATELYFQSAIDIAIERDEEQTRYACKDSYKPKTELADVSSQQPETHLQCTIAAFKRSRRPGRRRAARLRPWCNRGRIHGGSKSQQGVVNEVASGLQTKSQQGRSGHRDRRRDEVAGRRSHRMSQ
ncbi:hypothetical protein H6P81_016432 [Aristolochia fimbriata]|uniref:Uncharacterized protein n=1 Tax=Aristolochia fimbriata TaxID=158543 RepID=A0AAV7EC37_ARIFI|nr:hypothetical protein H6P81_016432 [Aristolochia fimbriata]